jgi:hypothetical protein
VHNSPIPQPADWVDVSPSAETHACEHDVLILATRKDIREQFYGSCFSSGRPTFEFVGSASWVGLSSTLPVSVVRPSPLASNSLGLGCRNARVCRSRLSRTSSLDRSLQARLSHPA